MCQDSLFLSPRPDGDRFDDRTNIPATPHQAYIAGWDAARRGDDLVLVVYAALCTWPADDFGELAELITCAELGYRTGEGGTS